MSKITELKISNVLRISAVHLTFDEANNLVVIAGKNDSGKTSVLSSIEMLFGGERCIPPQPVHRGAEKGEIIAKLSCGASLRRVIKADGKSTLVVTAADGAKYPSPAAFAKKLWGDRTFDPLDFDRMKPADQLETLKKLVGLDFTAQDAEAKKLFDQRTEVGRQAKQKQGELTGKPKVEGVPDKEVSVAELVAEQERLMKVNQGNERLRQIAGDCGRRCVSQGTKLEAARRDVVRLEKMLVEAKDAMASEAKALSVDETAKLAADKAVATAIDVDLVPIKAKLSTVEETNRGVRQNAERLKLLAECDAMAAKGNALTRQIDKLNMDKQHAIAAAAFPVPGLGFGPAGVTFDGYPLEQCSRSKRIRVSMAMGFATRSEVRAVLIQDGNDLDADQLKVIAEMADEADCQVVMERIGETGPVTVVIEDGHVAGDVAQVPAANGNGQPQLKIAQTEPEPEPTWTEADAL